MAVLIQISLDHVRRELDEAGDLIQSMGLKVDDSMLSEHDLRFRISGRSRSDDELYVVEFQCDDYRELPPFVEFVDPKTGQLGTRRAYPNVFHGHPCICARFNRKAYTGYSGLHSDWAFGDWTAERATDHIGGMISHIFGAILGHRSGYNYTGRLT